MIWGGNTLSYTAAVQRLKAESVTPVPVLAVYCQGMLPVRLLLVLHRWTNFIAKDFVWLGPSYPAACRNHLPALSARLPTRIGCSGKSVVP